MIKLFISHKKRRAVKEKRKTISGTSEIHWESKNLDWKRMTDNSSIIYL